MQHPNGDEQKRMDSVNLYIYIKQYIYIYDDEYIKEMK